MSEFIGSPLGATWSEIVLGVVFAATTLPVLRLCVRLHSGLARLLLVDGHDEFSRPETTKERT